MDFFERKYMRRPHGEAHRCDRCWFWEMQSYFEGDEHPDDRWGECHRHAPRVSQNGMFQIRVAMSGILVALEKLANIEDKTWGFDYEFDPEEQYQTDYWPQTRASFWCGDFEQRPIAQTEEADRDCFMPKRTEKIT